MDQTFSYTHFAPEGRYAGFWAKMLRPVDLFIAYGYVEWYMVLVFTPKILDGGSYAEENGICSAEPCSTV